MVPTRHYSPRRFASCEGPSTKDNTHIRRTFKTHSRTVNFTNDMKFCDGKEHFLLNSVNKAKMIELIGTTLENCNISVIYSE